MRLVPAPAGSIEHGPVGAQVQAAPYLSRAASLAQPRTLRSATYSPRTPYVLSDTAASHARGGIVGILASDQAVAVGQAAVTEWTLDLEMRLDSMFSRHRVTFEEFRAFWNDGNALLRQQVAYSSARNATLAALVGGPDEWGVTSFEDYTQRIVSYEVLAKGATPAAAFALGSVGSPISGSMLIRTPPASMLYSFDIDWKQLLAKLLSALGIDDILGIIGELIDLFTGESIINELLSALKAWWKSTGEAAEKAKERAKEAVKKLIEKVKKYLVEKGGKLGKKVAATAAKLGIPGFVLGVILLFLASVLANFLWDAAFG
jgi:hypothetical protein